MMNYLIWPLICEKKFYLSMILLNHISILYVRSFVDINTKMPLYLLAGNVHITVLNNPLHSQSSFNFSNLHCLLHFSLHQRPLMHPRGWNVFSLKNLRQLKGMHVFFHQLHWICDEPHWLSPCVFVMVQPHCHAILNNSSLQHPAVPLKMLFS